MTNPTNSPNPLLPEKRSPVPPAPIHPLAALTTLVLDNIFGVVEIVDPLALVLTSVSVGVVGAVTTMFVQRFLSKDSWGASIAKGLVMGVLAGVPYQVAGTAVGIPLLAWAGLHEWIKLKPPRNQPPQLPPEDEIVEADVRDAEDKKDG
jgi:hypothetical protein